MRYLQEEVNKNGDGLTVRYLQEEIGDTLVATAGGQHEGGLTLAALDVHTDPSLQQQSDNVLVSDVARIHQRRPTSLVLLVHGHVTPAGKGLML